MAEKKFQIIEDDSAFENGKLHGREVNFCKFNPNYAKEASIATYKAAAASEVVAREVQNLVMVMSHLDSTIENTLTNMAELASGRDQVPSKVFYISVMGLFALLAVMFLYFTHQEARISRDGASVKGVHGP